MHILTLHCPDQSGIVAKVATCLHDNGCNIEESAQFHDTLSGHFFMRVVVSETQSGGIQKFEKCFCGYADDYKMTWRLYNAETPVKTLLMVSKADHCLNDILYRVRIKQLNLEITSIVSNHDSCRPLADRYQLPYYHWPVSKDTKANVESKLSDLIEQTDSELIVLARYMQILSSDLCDAYKGRIINIHHSFLPGFKGAKPYAQAYERGVKMIGATAHFATEDLDEGPIIEQETKRITHADTPEKLQAKGRDIESRVLSSAIELYSERRIFLHNGRTVIL
jgi:formyltetrahydrofolate deformylase